MYTHILTPRLTMKDRITVLISMCLSFTVGKSKRRFKAILRGNAYNFHNIHFQ